jgi:hypothetical protein
MNTLDVTTRLAVTVGGRYNLANIKLQDQLGDALNGDHAFQRFNPMIHATCKLAPGLKPTSMSRSSPTSRDAPEL